MATRDEKLQGLHDAQLPVAEAQALRAELTDEDQQKLAALAELDAALGYALKAEVDEHADLADLWAGLEAKLPQAAPVRLTTVAGAAAREAGPGGKVLPMRRRWAMPATAMAGLLAMAAVFLFFVWPTARPSNSCDVESLEVAGGSALVMQVPGEHGDATTVIWMDHQENDEWESL